MVSTINCVEYFPWFLYTAKNRMCSVVRLLWQRVLADSFGCAYNIDYEIKQAIAETYCK